MTNEDILTTLEAKKEKINNELGPLKELVNNATQALRRVKELEVAMETVDSDIAAVKRVQLLMSRSTEPKE